MKRLIYITTAISLICACSIAKKSNTVLATESHLDIIIDMWDGHYRNSDQIKEVQSQGGKVWRIDDSGEGGFLDVTSHYIKLDRPDIAEHVLYVEEYRDGVPEEIYRQRIYTLSIDSTNHIRVKMWPFKDKEKYVGSWKNRGLLDNLKKEEISAYPDKCDLLVRQIDDGYYMYMNGTDCTFGTKTFNYEVKLKKDVFSYRDKITDNKEGTITSAGNFAYHHLDRVR